ncbi:MAG: hypothetical protein E7277_02390 [Lachnospiraceae bacterium]|nr:hypothetical protein [Lachnospiraceae bacterium]
MKVSKWIGLICMVAMMTITITACSNNQDKKASSLEKLEWKQERKMLDMWHGDCYTTQYGGITYNAKAKGFDKKKAVQCIKNVEAILDYSDKLFGEKSEEFIIFLGFDTDNPVSIYESIRIPLKNHLSADTVWAIVKKAHTVKLDAGEYYGLFYRYAVGQGIVKETKTKDDYVGYFKKDEKQKLLDFCVPMMDSIYFEEQDAKMVREAIMDFATWYEKQNSYKKLETLCKAANKKNAQVVGAKNNWLTSKGAEFQYKEYAKIPFHYAEGRFIYGEGSYEITLSDVIWQWDNRDVIDLGYEYMVDGYREIEPMRKKEWSEAREFTKDFRPQKLPELYLLTHFVRSTRDGSDSVWGGMYDNSDSTIRLFADWETAQYIILHEYCHFLTMGKNMMIEGDPEDDFVEWIAVWLADIELNDEGASQILERTFEEKGIKVEGTECWDEKANRCSMRLKDYYSAAWFCEKHAFEDASRSVQEDGNVAYAVKLPAKNEDPDGFMDAYSTRGCLAIYVYEKYGIEKLIELGKENINCKKVLGISFDKLYFDMIDWVKTQIPKNK